MKIYFLKCFGTDEVNVFRGIRIIIHSQFDSIVVAADAPEDVTIIICQGKSASRLPAEFKLYHIVGTDLAGKLYAPLYPSSAWTIQNANTRRADTRKGEEQIEKEQKHN